MLVDLSKFHVVTVISNPIRFKSRYDLYRKFAKQMKDAGVQLTTVEIAFGDRPHEVTEAGNPRHVQLRSFEELWHKENMINLGIASLPDDWEYVAWVDADVFFVRPDWAIETAHQLQHYMVVQMFSQAVDMGPDYQMLHLHNGFVWSYHQNDCMPPQGAGYGGYYGYNPSRPFWHPGYAWAARREAIDYLGGLMDFAILGSADHHMAMALIGEVQRSVPAQIGPSYLRELKQWQARAEKYIMRDLGYIEGTINHFWHGKKKDRKYVERWEIITKNHFDPDKDLKRDWQGLLQLEVSNRKQIRLRDQVRRYFRQRNEDSIDI